MLDFNQVDEAAVKTYCSPDRFGPVSEKLIQNFYEGVLSPGDVALDIGVQYGVHLFGMRSSVGNHGFVLGIEANVERYAAMLKAVSNKGLTNVYLLNVAASNVEEPKDFFLNRTHSGRSSLVENRLTPSDVIEKHRVYAMRIDSLIPKTIKPAFMKMDIEGGEFPALLGAKELINSSGMVIVFEGALTSSARKFGLTDESVAAYMRDIGYSVFDLFGNAIDLASWSGARGWNFIAVKNDATLKAKIADALTSAWTMILKTELS
ncbi:MAG TPA: FkbM family methyltransferase [Rhizomicrobium sp.]